MMDDRQMNRLLHGDIAQLILELEQRYANNTKDTEAENDLAAAYTRRGMFKEAITLYEDLLKKYPDNPGCMVNLGFCYIRIDPTKAEAFLREAIQQAEHNPIDKVTLSLALTNIGTLYEDSQLFEFAYRSYQAASKINEENTMAKKYLIDLEVLANPANNTKGFKFDKSGIVVMNWDDACLRRIKDLPIDLSKFKIV